MARLPDGGGRRHAVLLRRRSSHCEPEISPSPTPHRHPSTPAPAPALRLAVTRRRRLRPLSAAPAALWLSFRARSARRRSATNCAAAAVRTSPGSVARSMLRAHAAVESIATEWARVLHMGAPPVVVRITGAAAAAAHRLVRAAGAGRAWPARPGGRRGSSEYPEPQPVGTRVAPECATHRAHGRGGGAPPGPSGGHGEGLAGQAGAGTEAAGRRGSSEYPQGELRVHGATAGGHACCTSAPPGPDGENYGFVACSERRRGGLVSPACRGVVAGGAWPQRAVIRPSGIICWCITSKKAMCGQKGQTCHGGAHATEVRTRSNRSIETWQSRWARVLHQSAPPVVRTPCTAAHRLVRAAGTERAWPARLGQGPRPWGRRKTQSRSRSRWAHVLHQRVQYRRAHGCGRTEPPGPGGGHRNRGAQGELRVGPGVAGQAGAGAGAGAGASACSGTVVQ